MISESKSPFPLDGGYFPMFHTPSVSGYKVTVSHHGKGQDSRAHPVFGMWQSMWFHQVSFPRIPIHSDAPISAGRPTKRTTGNSEMGRNLGRGESIPRTFWKRFRFSFLNGETSPFSILKPKEEKPFFIQETFPECNNVGLEQGNKTGHNLPILELPGLWWKINQDVIKLGREILPDTFWNWISGRRGMIYGKISSLPP